MLWLVDIRWVAISELDCENTETPNINLCVVASFTLDKFRGHPADSAYFGTTCVSLHRQLCGVTEIGKLDPTIAVDENIVTLDITMDNVPCV